MKLLREKRRNDSFSEDDYPELHNLTMIGYGGKKPQNISVLNNQNGGTAYLLQSLPPALTARNIRFPKHDFFTESFRYYDYRDIFESLHRLFLTESNNLSVRETRDSLLKELVNRIIERMWEVRAVCAEQYRAEDSRLSRYQKIWLCDDRQQERESDDLWLSELYDYISSWIVRTYEKLIGKEAFKLGEAERIHIHEKVMENVEALR